MCLWPKQPNTLILISKCGMENSWLADREPGMGKPLKDPRERGRGLCQRQLTGVGPGGAGQEECQGVSLHQLKPSKSFQFPF